jgi:iron complex transport system substrate-binding protein
MKKFQKTVPLLFLFVTVAISILCLQLESKAAEQSNNRIISLGPINTENIFLLGAGDRLVGNTSYCSRPEAARHVEKIGSVMQLSIEKIISLHPDLILATALTQPQQLAKLKSLGLNVVQFKQPASFAEICSQFLRLGQLLGVEKHARQIINKAQEDVGTIQRIIAPLKPQKVFLQVGANPLFGSVTRSFTNDFIVMAGGENIMTGQDSGATNREKVIARNPDVIIIAIMGSETGIAAEQKKKWQHVTVLKAVQNNQIHVINPDLVCSPSPVTFAGTLRVIAGFIHPEIAQNNPL